MKLRSQDHITALENDLVRSLRPVRPNPEFVNRLHTNLVSPVTMVVEKKGSPATSLGIFLVGMGLAVGLFLIWVVRQLR